MEQPLSMCLTVSQGGICNGTYRKCYIIAFTFGVILKSSSLQHQAIKGFGLWCQSLVWRTWLGNKAERTGQCSIMNSRERVLPRGGSPCSLPLWKFYFFLLLCVCHFVAVFSVIYVHSIFCWSYVFFNLISTKYLFLYFFFSFLSFFHMALFFSLSHFLSSLSVDEIGVKVLFSFFSCMSFSLAFNFPFTHPIFFLSTYCRDSFCCSIKNKDVIS